jgi:hypothetical protein
MFPAPTAGTEGNEPRNGYRNPGMVNVDSSVAKNTHVPWIGEAGNLQLRFDFINLFNHSTWVRSIPTWATRPSAR